MAEEGSDEKITITSGKKEIAYDAKSGRFFETNLQEEECIPDEEYCVVDPESGELIRLTVAEKERIFLSGRASVLRCRWKANAQGWRVWPIEGRFAMEERIWAYTGI